MSGNLRHNLERLRETSQTPLPAGLTKAIRRSSGEMIISIMRKRVSEVRAVIVPVAGFHQTSSPEISDRIGSPDAAKKTQNTPSRGRGINPRFARSHIKKRPAGKPSISMTYRSPGEILKM